MVLIRKSVPSFYTQLTGGRTLLSAERRGRKGREGGRRKSDEKTALFTIAGSADMAGIAGALPDDLAGVVEDLLEDVLGRMRENHLEVEDSAVLLERGFEIGLELSGVGEDTAALSEEGEGVGGAGRGAVEGMIAADVGVGDAEVIVVGMAAGNALADVPGDIDVGGLSVNPDNVPGVGPREVRVGGCAADEDSADVQLMAEQLERLCNSVADGASAAKGAADAVGVGELVVVTYGVVMVADVAEEVVVGPAAFGEVVGEGRRLLDDGGDGLIESGFFAGGHPVAAGHFCDGPIQSPEDAEGVEVHVEEFRVIIVDGSADFSDIESGRGDESHRRMTAADGVQDFVIAGLFHRGQLGVVVRFHFGGLLGMIFRLGGLAFFWQIW